MSHVFITGLPRCGSSWVGQVLASAGCARYVYEPFNAQWNRSLKGRLDYFQYLPLKCKPPQHVLRAARRAMAGRQTPHQLARAAYRGYWRAANGARTRILIKDPTACLLSGWLTHNFDLQCMLIYRHPCGFASSHARLGWALSTERLLQQPRLMRQHLGDYVDTLEAVRTDPWLTLGAFWGAAHRVMLNQARQAGNWLLMSYEDLCLDPQTQFAAIGQFVRMPLHVNETMFRSQNEEGREDPGSTRRDSARMASIWRSRLTPLQADSVLGAARAFNVDQLLNPAPPSNGSAADNCAI